jgi:hypothetical protein
MGRVRAGENGVKEYPIRQLDPFKTALAMFVVLLANGAALAQEDVPKFEIGAQFSLLSLRRRSQIVKHPIAPGAIGVAPAVGSRTEPGFGGRFTYNLTNILAFEAEGNLFPRSEVGRGMPGGRIFQGQFGVKAGKRFRRFGIFGKARPGFVGFTQVSKLLRTTIVNNPPPTPPFTVGEFGMGNDLYFSMDLGGVVEYYPAGRVFARFDLGDTIIRYGTYREQGAFFSRAIIERPSETKHNLQFGAGVGFRF